MHTADIFFADIFGANLAVVAFVGDVVALVVAVAFANPATLDAIILRLTETRRKLCILRALICKGSSVSRPFDRIFAT